MANKLTVSNIQKTIEKFRLEVNAKFQKEYDADPENNYLDEVYEENLDALVDEHDLCKSPFNGLQFELEDSEGGFEGAGDNCAKIFKVTDVATKQSVFFKYDGYYCSYDGASYTSCYLAEPYKVEITKWKKKGKK